MPMLALFVITMTACKWQGRIDGESLTADLNHADADRCPTIFVVGTEAYLHRARQLTVGPAEARWRAQEFVDHGESQLFGDPSETTLGEHYVIVGDQYLFSRDCDETHLQLCGHFVDGNTGKVTAKNTPWSVSFREHPEVAKRIKDAKGANGKTFTTNRDDLPKQTE